jgi:UDP-galactopyranose mutase
MGERMENRSIDYLIVGAGFYGAICAYELTRKGHKCLVLDKRSHIGGNCYTSNKDGINVHEYGPHIFHTSNEEVWKWINQFVEFNNFILSPVANYKDEIYSLPFNMWTFSKLWGITNPFQAKDIIRDQSKHIGTPRNLEEQAIKLVGTDVYEKLIKGYTTKQWKKDPKELPKEIIKRLPVRFTYDSNYFNDKYQGIPIGGYTQIFEKLLKKVEVKLETDYLENKEYWNTQATKIIYTGPIDRYYDYQFGFLEYKSTEFIHFLRQEENVQGTALMNFTDVNVKQTRIIEHKHFEKTELPHSWITYETPTEYIPEKIEPLYPVNDKENTEKYLQYKNLADQESNIIFGGRLAEYKYYDMHQVIESALNKVKEIYENNL